MDSRGVAEYIRALVITNAISEYLPDEQTGKPSSLPALVLLPSLLLESVVRLSVFRWSTLRSLNLISLLSLIVSTVYIPKNVIQNSN